MALQKVLGRCRQSSLLARIDALGAVDEGARAAIAHLDENQFGVVSHDQVDFSVAAAVVSRYQGQAFADKAVQGDTFRPVSPIRRRRS